jgi:hypothetical protein
MDDQLPNGFLVGDEFSCHPVALINRPENLPLEIFRGGDPRVDRNFDRGGYGNRAQTISFPYENRNKPAAPLDPVDFEAHELGAAQHAVGINT